VPGDLSIVGFDDSAPEAEGLTTIHQPLREKGRAGAELLLRLLAGDAEDGARTVLPTRLVERASVSRPAS
jgi:DNA-binding LacI/PurR family transcriptional regulator